MRAPIRDFAPGTGRRAAKEHLIPFASGQFDNDRAIETFAGAGLFDETVASLAFLSDLPTEIVEYSLVRAGPEAVDLLVQAAGLTKRSADALLRLRARSQTSPAPAQS